MGNARKVHAGRLDVTTPTPRELNSFHHMQSLLSKASILVHFDSERRLYIDMDASKERGIGGYLYHVSNEPLDKPPGPKTIQPILFLSRDLIDAETRYWPTELEISGLVWMIKKVRHLVEASKLPVIVYTDHSSTVNIAKQSSLNTTSIEKLNLRLVRSSEYLQRFRLDIRHRPGKTNVIPDALSRLPVVEECKARLIERDAYRYEDGDALANAQEVVSAHPVSLVEISEEFKARLMDGYREDPRWVRINELIERNERLRRDGNAADIPYRIIRNLIYFVDPEVGLRLCIPQSMIGEVFGLAHDELGHVGYDRTHERLTEGLYIYNMAKELRRYILHCPECQLCRTPRHRPYGLLQSIISPARPFDTITIDFILALLLSKPEKFDCILSVTDKFSKAITLIPGKIATGGKEWAILLLDRLCLLNWGLPRAILSDRDRRFIGQLWRGLFDQLKVSLLYSTSYHPQTDGMSERTNQTVEIALRYYLATLESLDQWPSVLPRMSQALCNSTNYSSTMKTPTEILFGFKTREALDLLRINESPPIELDDANDTNINDRNEPIEQPIEAYPIATRRRRTSYQSERPEPIRRGETHRLPNLDEY